MAGWVKLHRKLLENSIFQKPELLQLFLYCLLRANHEPKKMIFNGKEITIERGQFITGREILCKELRQKATSTYKRLKLLEELQILNIKSNNKFSVVSIVNYEFYQSQDEKSDSKSDNQGTTKEQPSDTNKKLKNYKNEEEVASANFQIIPNIQKYLGDISLASQAEILSYQDKGLDADVIIECVRESLTGEYPQKYVIGILDRCVQEKVTCLQQFIDKRKERQKNKEELIKDLQKKKKQMPQHENYTKREYTEDDYEQYYEKL